MKDWSLSNGAFERTGKSAISEREFYFYLTISVLWGLIATATTASYAASIGYYPSGLGILFIGLLIPFLGIMLSATSDNPLVSFIGYNMITIPFGFILGPVLNIYSAGVVAKAFGMTALITFVMGFLGVAYPNVFKDMGGALFTALLGLLVVRIMQIFIPALAALTIVDYIAALIFSLYIAYDMYRASVVARTIDNAIDISVALYLDIVNLFLTLLKIYANKD